MTLKELYNKRNQKGLKRNELPKSWYQFNLGCHNPERLSDLLKMNLAELKEDWYYWLKKDRQGIKVAVSDVSRLVRKGEL